MTELKVDNRGCCQYCGCRFDWSHHRP